MISYHKTLLLDIESYSSVDLKNSGVAVYSASSDFEVLLFAYSWDFGPVEVLDLTKNKLPNDIKEALENPDITKIAFNAIFERQCLSRYLGYPVDKFISSRGWHDAMIMAAYVGINGSLKVVGEVMGITNQKIKEGGALIKYFCMPCTPTKKNGGRTRNRPEDDPEKWDKFIEYNKRDVEAEMDIVKKLEKWTVPDFIWEEYYVDQAINDRGVLVDTQLVKQAIDINEKISQELLEQMKDKTQLENPNSVAQLKSWLSSQGMNITSLGKKEVEDIKKMGELNLQIEEVLTLRELTSKTSIKKYQAMLDSIDSDNRARGLFQFYSCKTARWSSRRIQLQNLKRNEMKDLDQARTLVKEGNIEALKMLYENIPDVLSQLIRTSFISPEGKKLIVADYSAIEARVLAYISGEKWRNEAFISGKDIYCESASKMFHVPVVKHGVNGELRSKGKIAELALGYNGGVGALEKMGAKDMGLTDSELQEIVTLWRDASPNIVKLWRAVGNAAKSVIQDGITKKVGMFTFRYKSKLLFVDLPSGRPLVYVRPRVEGSGEITYEAMNQGSWVRLNTHGGKIVENITQALAADILANALCNLKDYDVVMHIHDEVVVECSKNTEVKTITSLMEQTPDWCKDLCLKAEGYETPYYKKD